MGREEGSVKNIVKAMTQKAMSPMKERGDTEESITPLSIEMSPVLRPVISTEELKNEKKIELK